MLVEEVYGFGHEDLKQDHLDYIKHMANRVGFTVLRREPGFGEAAFRITLHISMKNPEFIVQLRSLEAPSSEPGERQAADGAS